MAEKIFNKVFNNGLMWCSNMSKKFSVKANSKMSAETCSVCVPKQV